jgi:hypothetical protein
MILVAIPEYILHSISMSTYARLVPNFSPPEVKERQNLNTSQPSCSRDPAPLARAPEGSQDLSHKNCQLLTRGPLARGPKSVTTQPLPARTHPQRVAPVCLQNALATPHHAPYVSIAGKFRIQSASNCPNSIARDIYYPSTGPCDRGRANPRLQSPRFLSCESR